MMIEGSGENQFGNEQEWYYGNGEKERIGPKGFSEVCYILVPEAFLLLQPSFRGFFVTNVLWKSVDIILYV